MSRLDELQHEFMERHKDADLIECYPAPPKGNGKVARAIYLSPQYKADEPIREFFALASAAPQETVERMVTFDAEGKSYTVTFISADEIWLTDSEGTTFTQRPAHKEVIKP